MGEAVLAAGLTFAMWVGALATARGRGFVGWTLLALLLTPIIACIILVCLPKLDDAKRPKVFIVVTATGLVTLAVAAGIAVLLA